MKWYFYGIYVVSQCTPMARGTFQQFLYFLTYKNCVYFIRSFLYVDFSNKKNSAIFSNKKISADFSNKKNSAIFSAEIAA